MERSGIRDELRACSRIPFTLHPGYSAEVFLRSVNEGVMVRFSAFKRSKSPVKEGNPRSVRGNDGRGETRGRERHQLHSVQFPRWFDR